MNARGNQRWNCFKSDKVAEISYASKFHLWYAKARWILTPSLSSLAIQGKDCLVQKFRNSSVMLEAPHYRPKVSHLQPRTRYCLTIQALLYLQRPEA